ncbi:MAG: hypothetical protein ACK2U9_04555 [Anaerolineae bacterium]
MVKTKHLTPFQILLAILAVSVILRLGIAAYYGNWIPPRQDDQSYSLLAQRLAEGYGYSFGQPWYPFTPANTPTAHWSFLYVAFLAGVYRVVGVVPLVAKIIGAILGGLLLPYLLYKLALRIRPGDFRLALLSAACGALYAYFVLFSARLMTETFYIIAVLWSLERALTLEQSLRRGEPVRPVLAVTLGISLGLATLLRQSILPWVPVMSLYLLWVGYRQRRLGRAFLALAGAGVVVALFILPFTVRNYLVYDDFLLLNSNAGYAMYSAQHPLHGTSFQAYLAAPLPDDLNPQPQNEAQWDRALMARGLQFIVDDPGRYLLLSLSRVADYFEAWPTSDSSLLFNVGRLLSFTLFLPFMLYGLYLSLRPSQLTIDNSSLTIDRSSFALLYLFIAFYSLLHIMTWAMTRYRLPVDAVLLVFAALGIGDLMDRLAARRRAGHPRMPQAPRIHE